MFFLNNLLIFLFYNRKSKYTATLFLLTSTQAFMSTNSQTNTRPALSRPWAEWTPEQKQAGAVLGLGEDYMTKPPTCFDGKCWDHSNQKDLSLTPLSEEEKAAFICLGGTKEGFEIQVLGRFPCPLAGKCCFCTGVFRGAPPPPESLRGCICDSMFQHCYSECCQPQCWTKIL